VRQDVLDRLIQESREIEEFLEQAVGGQKPRQDGLPEFKPPSLAYEMSDRTRAIDCGGIAGMHQFVASTNLADVIDLHLKLLSRHHPYSESDHILNIAYNILCGGQVLQDIEIRRSDPAYAKVLGARTIPAPTTAGDFCRRFDSNSIWLLMETINLVRLAVWNTSSRDLKSETAKLDADGTFVSTKGQTKQGMSLAYDGTWGYHALVISLANTGEPLFIVNRPGNRPSHEGAPETFDKAIALCRQFGFPDILLRGDTDFSMTAHLDRWDDQGVRFVFGYDASRPFVGRAKKIEDQDYEVLVRKAESKLPCLRTKAPPVKQQTVERKGYLDQVLVKEETSEFDHQPTKAAKTYRIVVLRKTIEERRNNILQATKYRYFFYITNDRKMTQAEVIAESNARCNQENLHGQLKSGVRALHSPLNTLEANWAYYVIASLAWTFKAWFALQLPISPAHRDEHREQQDRLLRMEFRTFLNRMIRVPAQILSQGKQVIVRLLAWRPDIDLLIRLVESL
jgi:hypothetical protein